MPQRGSRKRGNTQHVDLGLPIKRWLYYASSCHPHGNDMNFHNEKTFYEKWDLCALLRRKRIATLKGSAFIVFLFMFHGLDVRAQTAIEKILCKYDGNYVGLAEEPRSTAAQLVPARVLR